MKAKSNLLKNLDLINFWEPFERPIPELRVGLREIISDQRKKYQEVKLSKDAIKKVKPRIFKAPYVISFNTTNQKEALLPLYEELGSAVELMSENPHFTNELLPDAYLKSESLRFSSNMLKWFYTFKGRDKKVFQARYYNFYRRLGQYSYYKKAFERSKDTLKAYIASNDHSGLSQVGFVAAKDAGIKTIYIPHASISDKFPPLMADMAFLDGENAKRKYLSAGDTNTKIHLVGSMKFDKYLRRRELTENKELVGVCVGIAFHDIEENFKLCQALESREIPFCLRFHPLMDDKIQKRFLEQRWEISFKDENACDFILRCGNIISGDSNILLEATILNRRAIYFASTGKVIDYYGFVKEGICTQGFTNISDVLKELSTPFNIAEYRAKAKNYHHGLGTELESQSSQTILDIPKDELE